MSVEEGFVALPRKSELARRAGLDPNAYWLMFVVETPKRVLVPQEILEKVRLLREGKRVWVIRRELAPLIRLYAIENFGTRKHPKWAVTKIIDANGRVVRELPKEEGVKKFEELRRYLGIWRTALERAVYTELPEPKVIVDEAMGYAELDPLGIRVIVENRGRYQIVRFALPFDMPEQAKELVRAAVREALGKLGFTSGFYGGLIHKAKMNEEQWEKFKKEALEAIKVALEGEKEDVAKIIEEYRRLKYNVKRADIRDAREKLGINIPPEEPVSSKDMIAFLTGRKEGDAGELLKSLRELQVKLKEFAEKEEEEGKRGGQEAAVKEEREASGPEERIDVEKLVKDYLSKEGLIKAKLVVFDLPTEYKGAHVEIYVDPESGEEIEVRHLGKAAEIYRKWRARFYRVLHKVAFRTKAGWVIASWADPRDLQELSTCIEALNRLAGTRRLIYVIDVYLPKDYVLKELADNILEVKEKLAQRAKEKVEEEKEKRSARRALRQLQEELQKLVAEARRLGADVEELVREHREERMEMARRLAGAELETSSPQLLVTVYGRKLALGFLARTIGAELPKKLQAYAASPAIVVLPRDIEKLPTELQQQVLPLLEQAAVKIKHNGRTVAYALVGEAAITAYQNILRSLHRKNKQKKLQAQPQPA